MGYCRYCDPKYYIIYGFCRSCNRRCYPPLYDPNGDMSILDYDELMKNWNAERSDLINDIIRQQEGSDVCPIEGKDEV